MLSYKGIKHRVCSESGNHGGFSVPAGTAQKGRDEAKQHVGAVL